jgi:hypothetical protein
MSPPQIAGTHPPIVEPMKIAIQIRDFVIGLPRRSAIVMRQGQRFLLKKMQYCVSARSRLPQYRTMYLF